MDTAAAAAEEGGMVPINVRDCHIKKRILKNKSLSVTSNEKDLKDDVSGPDKRKKKRIKEALENKEETELAKRIERGKKRKLERDLIINGVPRNSGTDATESDEEHVHDENNESVASVSVNTSPTPSRSVGGCPNPSPSHAGGDPSPSPSPGIGSEISHKTFIQPRGNEFSRESECARSIGKIIINNFYGPWKSWKKIPQEARDMWFTEFKKMFCWQEKDNYCISKIFDHKGSKILSNKLYRQRKMNKRPYWIKEKAWKGLLEEWAKEDHQKISQVNKGNRSSFGGVGYRGGSISHLAHKDKSEDKLVHVSKTVKLFMHKHSSIDDKREGKCLNDGAENTHKKVIESIDARSSHSSNGGDELPQPNTREEIADGGRTCTQSLKGTIEDIDTLKTEVKKMSSQLESYKQMFESLKHFLPYVGGPLHSPYPPVPYQSPYPSGYGNPSYFYPLLGYGSMPPLYASCPEEPPNMPCSAKPHNKNELKPPNVPSATKPHNKSEHKK